MKILIKSAKIVAPESSFHNKVVDVLIENDKISEISESISVGDGVTVVEKENLHVSPGWFAVGVLPNTFPVIDRKADVEFLVKRSMYNAVTIYPIGALSKKREGTELSETFDMSNSGAIAFGDDKSIENEKLMEVSLLYNKTVGKPVLSFPETNSITHGGQMNEGVNAINLGLKFSEYFDREISKVNC